MRTIPLNRYRPLPPISVSDRIHQDLEEMLASGLYGFTIADVVDRILCGFVRGEITAGRLQQRRATRATPPGARRKR